MFMISKRRSVSVLALITMISIIGCAALAGCKSAQPSETTTKQTTTETEATSSVADPAEPQKLYVTVKGTDIRVGMKFSEVSKALGSPDQEFQATSCSSDTVEITYQYGGLQITTSQDKIITIFFDSSNGNTSSIILGGKIKTGDTIDAVKSAFGKPTSEDDGFLNYVYGKTQLQFIIVDNSIDSISIMNYGIKT